MVERLSAFRLCEGFRSAHGLPIVVEIANTVSGGLKSRAKSNYSLARYVLLGTRSFCFGIINIHSCPRLAIHNATVIAVVVGSCVAIGFCCPCMDAYLFDGRFLLVLAK